MRPIERLYLTMEVISGGRWEFTMATAMLGPKIDVGDTAATRRLHAQCNTGLPESLVVTRSNNLSLPSGR